MAAWRAIAQGENEEKSNNHLQENFKEDLSKDEALYLAMETIM